MSATNSDRGPAGTISTNRLLNLPHPTLDRVNFLFLLLLLTRTPSMASPAPPADMAQIHALRHFNRYYTQRISVLSPVHDADMTLADNRVLYEVANPHGDSTASAIGKRLGLDAGYLSRILRKLETKGYVRRDPSPRDARATLLSMTDEGWHEYRTLEALTNAEIGGLLAPLTPERRDELMRAMATVESILDPAPASKPPAVSPASPASEPPAKRVKRSAGELQPAVELRDLQTGAGDLGWILSAHSELYWAEKGWNEEFERLVAGILAEFRPTERERAWIAEVNGERAGCIFLVKSPNSSRDFAKIRVLLVMPNARGCGLASRLVDACITFARENGYKGIELETEGSLAPARRLYASRGFVKVSEKKSAGFGVDEFVSESWELVF